MDTSKNDIKHNKSIIVIGAPSMEKSKLIHGLEDCTGLKELNYNLIKNFTDRELKTELSHAKQDYSYYDKLFQDALKKECKNIKTSDFNDIDYQPVIKQNSELLNYYKKIQATNYYINEIKDALEFKKSNPDFKTLKEYGHNEVSPVIIAEKIGEEYALLYDMLYEKKCIDQLNLSNTPHIVSIENALPLLPLELCQKAFANLSDKFSLAYNQEDCSKCITEFSNSLEFITPKIMLTGIQNAEIFIIQNKHNKPFVTNSFDEFISKLESISKKQIDKNTNFFKANNFTNEAEQIK